MGRYGIILLDDGALKWVDEWKDGEWRHQEFKSVEDTELFIHREGIKGELYASRAYVVLVKKEFEIESSKNYAVREQ
jgi:hypothetical protein